jgi:hypothetical protein
MDAVAGCSFRFEESVSIKVCWSLARLLAKPLKPLPYWGLSPPSRGAKNGKAKNKW